MTIAVPTLLTKVARYRPRFVCFVGVGIWRTVEKILMKTGPNNTNGHTPNPAGSSKTDKGCVTRLGLQPYKLVYDIKPSEQIGIVSKYCEYLKVFNLFSRSKLISARDIILCCPKYVWKSC